MLEKQNGQEEKMNSVAQATNDLEEMADLMRHVASPAIAGDKPPHAIARAARRLGFSKRRVKAFWYGEARRVDPEELEAARKAAAERTQDARLLRREYQRAVEILERLEARLTRTDEDFHSPDIGALRDGISGAVGPRISARPNEPEG